MSRRNLFRLFLFVPLALGLAGCYALKSSDRLDRVSLGMSRDEVVAILGKPDSVSAQGDVQYLAYTLLAEGIAERREYVVRLQANHVESFGEKSDFGQTKFATPPASAPSPGPAAPPESKKN